MARALLVSGFDLRDVPLPDDVEVLMPPLPLPAQDDFRGRIIRAFEEPVAGLPLSRRVKASSKVTLVIDDFTYPVPLALSDARKEMLETVLELLTSFKVRPSNITAVVGTGI